MLPVSVRHNLLSFNGFLKPRLQSSRVFLPYKPLISHRGRRMMATAMAKRLEGKTIVVTGASSGIGRSTGLVVVSTFDKH